MRNYSVVIPAFNSEGMIKIAVESMLRQTHRPKEIIVIDDCSSDETYKEVSALKSQGIRLFRNQENSGIAYSLNKGFREAENEIVLRMDADDISYRDRAERQVGEILRTNGMTVIGGDSIIYDNDKKKMVGRCFYPMQSGLCKVWLAAGRSPLCHPAVAMCKVLHEKIGGYDENWVPAEDLEAWIKVYSVGGEIRNTGKVEVGYRRHSSSTSTRQQALQLELTSRLRKKAEEVCKTNSFMGSGHSGEERASGASVEGRGLKERVEICFRREVDKEIMRSLVGEKRRSLVRKAVASVYIMVMNNMALRRLGVSPNEDFK